MKKANKLTLILLISFISVLALSSCKLKAEQESLTARFEIIDSLIHENLFKDALTELKRTEKVCYDSWSYLGVFKRFQQLDEKAEAEKTIKKALKKNGKNPELIAREKLSQYYLTGIVQENNIIILRCISFCLIGCHYFHVGGRSGNCC